MKQSWLFFLLALFTLAFFSGSFFSCANIVPPSGGPRDSLPPFLLKAVPDDSSVHFTTKKITLSFDEYVTVDNPQDNIVVWPNPKNPPEIESKLRTVTIKLKDSLEPNTTYTILFGKGLKDVNEGNVDSGFNYVFSTGDRLDKNVLKGKVALAETGKIDSTLIVVLQANLTDTAIRKNAPRYYAKLDGKGNFRFFHLPTNTFNVFVVPNDYTKRYDDSTKLFAFADKPVYLHDTSAAPLMLYAYREFKEEEKKPAANTTSKADKTPSKKGKTKKDSALSVTADIESGKQDFLRPLQLTFSDTLQSYDTTRFRLTDTNFKPMPEVFTMSPDSTNTKLSLSYPWKTGTPYKLIIEKEAVKDSAGFALAKNDTLSFTTLRESDYGSVRIRFQNLDTSKHPVLLLLQNDKIVQSVHLTSYDWYQKFIRPGDYELRMLYDDNRNGVWDPGSYDARRQPEIVKQITYRNGSKITIRANWDNEENITL